jgi:hypothetical protein
MEVCPFVYVTSHFLSLVQELLLPLDYKDLCFAEETVDRKVKVDHASCWIMARLMQSKIHVYI